MGSDGDDVLDQILNADDSLGSEDLLDLEVGVKWDSAFLDLSVASLVDEIGDGLPGRGSIGDPWLNNSKHVHDGLVVFEEDGVVDLSESEKPEDLSWLGGEGVDTLDSDHKEKLALGLYVHGSGLFGLK